jgi:hypothetical protein
MYVASILLNVVFFVKTFTCLEWALYDLVQFFCCQSHTWVSLDLSIVFGRKQFFRWLKGIGSQLGYHYR